MKRILWLSLLAAAILIVGATVALAQESASTAVTPLEAAPTTGLPAPDVQPGFVDADGDGVCDNCGQGLGNSNAPGRNFVDANGDGVCDNCAANGGQGPRGPRNGNGGGANFVDADGDGVCDNMGQNASRGGGRGFRGGRGG